MDLYSENEHYKLYHGSMLDMLEILRGGEVSSIVTDPPYELNFMGKGWDNSGIAFNPDTWKKCLEVLKPGGYLLAFGGSRTYHRIACAIEDAGFEIRDCIMWLYGSGFPKSLALDKSIEGKLTTGSANTQGFRNLNGEKADRGTYGYAKMKFEQGDRPADYNKIEDSRLGKLEATTELAKKYKGWGTALKPSYEPIIVARKPLEGSCTDNVIKYGVGGINIDECRVGTEVIKGGTIPKMGGGELGVCNYQTVGAERLEREDNIGRFPANTILTYGEEDKEEVCSGFPNTKGGIAVRHNSGGNTFGGNNKKPTMEDLGYNDSGSAARYFYCAKASKRDRDEGCTELEDGLLRRMRPDKDDSNPTGLNKEGRFAPVVRKNTHPTVKPTELMQYLVRLVTPNGGTVLDPFNGSGSTGKAVMYENKDRNKNYKYIGIELTDEYLPIAKARIEYAINVVEEKSKELDKQQPLFEI